MALPGKSDAQVLEDARDTKAPSLARNVGRVLRRPSTRKWAAVIGSASTW
jgi:predicted NAD-dependent protein-ADP-ribosyltransferase YbiA (DUF1768 family)